MTKYIWQHGLEGEAERLRTMAALLDPSTRAQLERLPLAEDWRCLEIGAGTATLSAWLADRLGPKAEVVATDINTDLMQGLAGENLKVRALDAVKEDIGEGLYDLVFTRAVLHHLPEAPAVVAKMVRAVRPGGWIYIDEPDFHPTLIEVPEGESALRRDFLAWGVKQRIDHFIGHKVPRWLQELGLEEISAEARTQIYPGGSLFARWYLQGQREVIDKMLADDTTTEEHWRRFEAESEDPDFWTMTFALIGVSARRPS